MCMQASSPCEKYPTYGTLSRSSVPLAVIDEEAELMDALANAQEDDQVNDGGLEGSGDEYEES